MNNGDKQIGIYDEEAIIKEFLPRFIGYSANDVQAYGTKDFHARKEMGSVWRFLYKRSVIAEHGIQFSVDVRLNEDSLFNCCFFCFASRICYINDVLYAYYSKDEGAMFSILKNWDILFQNKLAVKHERMNLQKLYLEKHGIDVFPLFAGSLFLSVVEIAVKSNSFLKGIKAFLAYVKDRDVKKAVSVIPVKGSFKIKIVLCFLKMRCFFSLYSLIYLANKLGVKRW